MGVSSGKRTSRRRLNFSGKDTVIMIPKTRLLSAGDFNMIFKGNTQTVAIPTGFITDIGLAYKLIARDYNEFSGLCVSELVEEMK